MHMNEDGVYVHVEKRATLKAWSIGGKPTQFAGFFLTCEITPIGPPSWYKVIYGDRPHIALCQSLDEAEKACKTFSALIEATSGMDLLGGSMKVAQSIAQEKP